MASPMYQGKRVKVWWPVDECHYEATVDKLSNNEVELVYDNGMRQTYPRTAAFLSRIMIAKVPEHARVHTSY